MEEDSWGNVGVRRSWREEEEADDSPADGPQPYRPEALPYPEALPSCPICLSDILDPRDKAVTDCMHTFCERCLAAWLRVKRFCPLCKRRVRSYMTDIRDDARFTEVEVPPSPPPQSWAPTGPSAYASVPPGLPIRGGSGGGGGGDGRSLAAGATGGRGGPSALRLELWRPGDAEDLLRQLHRIADRLAEHGDPRNGLDAGPRFRPALAAGPSGGAAAGRRGRDGEQGERERERDQGEGAGGSRQPREPRPYFFRLQQRLAATAAATAGTAAGLPRVAHRFEAAPGASATGAAASAAAGAATAGHRPAGAAAAGLAGLIPAPDSTTTAIAARRRVYELGVWAMGVTAPPPGRGGGSRGAPVAPASVAPAAGGSEVAAAASAAALRQPARREQLEAWIGRELAALLQRTDLTLLRGLTWGLVEVHGLERDWREPEEWSRGRDPQPGPGPGGAASASARVADAGAAGPAAPVGGDSAGGVRHGAGGAGGGGGGPVEALRPFLFEHAGHFWHELRCYALSGLSLPAYDACVRYGIYANHQPAPAEGSQPPLAPAPRSRHTQCQPGPSTCDDAPPTSHHHRSHHHHHSHDRHKRAHPLQPRGQVDPRRPSLLAGAPLALAAGAGPSSAAAAGPLARRDIPPQPGPTGPNGRARPGPREGQLRIVLAPPGGGDGGNGDGAASAVPGPAVPSTSSDGRASAGQPGADSAARPDPPGPGATGVLGGGTGRAAPEGSVSVELQDSEGSEDDVVEVPLVREVVDLTLLASSPEPSPRRPPQDCGPGPTRRRSLHPARGPSPVLSPRKDRSPGQQRRSRSRSPHHRISPSRRRSPGPSPRRSRSPRRAPPLSFRLRGSLQGDRAVGSAHGGGGAAADVPAARDSVAATEPTRVATAAGRSRWSPKRSEEQRPEPAAALAREPRGRQAGRAPSGAAAEAQLGAAPEQGAGGGPSTGRRGRWDERPSEEAHGAAAAAAGALGGAECRLGARAERQAEEDGDRDGRRCRHRPRRSRSRSRSTEREGRRHRSRERERERRRSRSGGRSQLWQRNRSGSRSRAREQEQRSGSRERNGHRRRSPSGGLAEASAEDRAGAERSRARSRHQEGRRGDVPMTEREQRVSRGKSGCPSGRAAESGGERGRSGEGKQEGPSARRAERRAKRKHRKREREREEKGSTGQEDAGPKPEGRGRTRRGRRGADAAAAFAEDRWQLVVPAELV